MKRLMIRLCVIVAAVAMVASGEFAECSKAATGPALVAEGCFAKATTRVDRWVGDLVELKYVGSNYLNNVIAACGKDSSGIYHTVTMRYNSAAASGWECAPFEGVSRVTGMDVLPASSVYHTLVMVEPHTDTNKTDLIVAISGSPRYNFTTLRRITMPGVYHKVRAIKTTDSAISNDYTLFLHSSYDNVASAAVHWCTYTVSNPDTLATFSMTFVAQGTISELRGSVRTVGVPGKLLVVGRSAETQAFELILYTSLPSLALFASRSLSLYGTSPRMAYDSNTAKLIVTGQASSLVTAYQLISVSSITDGTAAQSIVDGSGATEVTSYPGYTYTDQSTGISYSSVAILCPYSSSCRVLFTSAAATTATTAACQLLPMTVMMRDATPLVASLSVVGSPSNDVVLAGSSNASSVYISSSSSSAVSSICDFSCTCSRLLSTSSIDSYMCNQSSCQCITPGSTPTTSTKGCSITDFSFVKSACLSLASAGDSSHFSWCSVEDNQTMLECNDDGTASQTVCELCYQGYCADCNDAFYCNLLNYTCKTGFTASTQDDLICYPSSSASLSNATVVLEWCTWLRQSHSDVYSSNLQWGCTDDPSNYFFSCSSGGGLFSCSSYVKGVVPEGAPSPCVSVSAATANKSSLSTAELVVLVVVLSAVGVFLVTILSIISLVLLRHRLKQNKETIYANSSQTTQSVQMSDLTNTSTALIRPVNDGCTPYNAVAFSELGLEVSTQSLTFGGAGNQVPIDTLLTETVVIASLASLTSSTVAFIIQLPPEDPYRYQLSVNRLEAKLEKREQLELTFTLKLLCTTTLQLPILIRVPKQSGAPAAELLVSVTGQLSTKLDASDLKFGDVLGAGAFGSVYRGLWRGTDVAVKSFNESIMVDETLKGDIIREVIMCSALRSPFIVGFYGSAMAPGKFFIVMELVPKGSLGSLVKKGPLPLDFKQRVVLDVARGLAFLHANNIIHRDIKTDNVLVASIDSNAPVCGKLSDFGTSRFMGSDVNRTKTKGIGTPLYMAPEILSGKTYNTAADVYSYAILVWNVVTQQEPYGGFENQFVIYNFVASGKRLPIPEDTPANLKQTMEECWKHEPTARPTFADVISILTSDSK